MTAHHFLPRETLQAIEIVLHTTFIYIMQIYINLSAAKDAV